MWGSWADLGLKWPAVVRLVGCITNYLKILVTTLETAYGNEMNVHFSGNSSERQSCSQSLRHL